MNVDFDTSAPATSLGFSLPVGPIAKDLPPLSEPTDETQLSELIRQKALVNVNVLAEILTLKAINPTATVKTVADALDANYKLSGLAAKNQAKELSGMVSIVINIPKTGVIPEKTIQLDGSVIDVVPPTDDIRSLPDTEPSSADALLIGI